MTDAIGGFASVWLVDFEFCQPDGERPYPLCMVAREMRSGQLLRIWRDGLLRLDGSPMPTRDDALFVAYYASAELGCYLALDWPLPTRILDLYAEFRCLTSGLPVTCGHGLLGALTHYGLDGIDAADKESMRGLAMRGGKYSAAERTSLLDYCQSDVDSLVRLLPAMLPSIDLPRAMLRGRYMSAAARMERTGVPLDAARLKRLRDGWQTLKSRLIDSVDRDYHVFEAGTFKVNRFSDYLIRTGTPWPRLPTGSLALDGDTFRQMAKGYPRIAPLRELRHALSELRLEGLAVGSDGRNRCLLSAFASRTSRNQPSNSKFIFGPSVWLRGLIRPPEGHALAYLDWSQQEFGVAAALSGDAAMMSAYSSGDPYLEFAKQAGAVPPDATKESHGAVRELFKTCALGTQYGMEAKSLAERLGSCEAQARQLLWLHRETYPTFWKWSQAAVDRAMLQGEIGTVFGWKVRVGPTCNARSLANFPMQANGAEMLRLACCLATERGIRVCAPVHDALLIEAAASEIDKAVTDCQDAMREASEVVLGGFELRSDAKVIRYPDRYSDPRGESFWRTIWELLDGSGLPKHVSPVMQTCITGDTPLRPEHVSR